MLLEFGITPIIVFDGAPLPMKKEVEEGRAKQREESKREAQDLWREGDAKKARKVLARGIDVTPEMAHHFIEVLKKKGVEYIVAPYEADAQMAYLYLNGTVSLVITEDSDLLAFGCGRVLFKLDTDGNGDEIDVHNLAKLTDLSPVEGDKDAFLRACILGGCDYLDSIRGMGFKTALKYMAASSNLDDVLFLLARENKFAIPTTYKKDFEKAFLTFKFQTVFDPAKKSLVFLTPIEGTAYTAINSYSDKAFLGPYHLLCEHASVDNTTAHLRSRSRRGKSTRAPTSRSAARRTRTFLRSAPSESSAARSSVRPPVRPRWTDCDGTRIGARSIATIATRNPSRLRRRATMPRRSQRRRRKNRSSGNWSARRRSSRRRVRCGRTLSGRSR